MGLKVYDAAEVTHPARPGFCSLRRLCFHTIWGQVRLRLSISPLKLFPLLFRQ